MRCRAISSARALPTFVGRSIGTVIIVSVQLLIGVIHVLFGLWLLSVSTLDCVYSVYTAVFGLMTLVFALGFWMGRSWGRLGTVSTLLFVTVADALTLLNLPSIPGIPKFAAVAEIGYSVVVLLYLVQPHVRANVLHPES